MDSEKYKIRDLDWDTEYFGVTSGRVDLLGDICEQDYEEIKNRIVSYDYVTIMNHNNSNINNEYIAKIRNAVLRDVNVQLVKQCNRNIRDENVEIGNNIPANDLLLQISKNSFVYSRFFNDSNLDIEKSKDMYYNRLKNSFNREDKYICIYKENGVELGFLLFSLDEQKSVATIELIAVDKEHSQKGIGRKMMTSFEWYVNNREIEKLEVGTQLQNITAQNFYISCGYRVSHYNSIYHVWGNKN